MTGLPPEYWPNRAHSRIVEAAPHRWHVQTIGDGDPVLLLHGAGASAHSWTDLITIFQAQNRLLVPDLPGHGFTRSPRGRARLTNVAMDLADLMNALEANPNLVVAHSAGAAVALEMVRRNLIAPDRLILVNAALEDFRGAAGVLFPVMAKMLALNPLTGLFLSSGSGSLGQVRSLIRSTGSELTDAALRPYADLVRRRAHVDGTLAMMAQWSLAELNRALPEIETPTLFIHGGNDTAVDTSIAKRAVSAMPNAELIVIDGVGHLAHEEAPERVAAEIAAFAATPALAQ
ncbi:alpha/beta fold hydrolase BchO [Gymnodinialimonas sp. 2305UL16-5]|uniref:alpha/beta fold hydrolase BchO n=1 Tax=Gymnodinialimonas mytili TaxID=3126503 RepID=UPI0030A03466